jgi:RNA polymerase sigma-70 factor (ECF subfamily)
MEFVTPQDSDDALDLFVYARTGACYKRRSSITRSGAAQMMEESGFRDLIKRIRGGDQSAAAELVHRYEPAIRRAARIRLVDPQLDRLIDSMDICQSVLASFFVRVHLGQYDLESPEQLLSLLGIMARNKVRDQARRLNAARRDCRLDRGGHPEALAALPGREVTPCEIVAGKELVEEVRRRLSPAEWRLVEQRTLGREWDEISNVVGSSGEALRKQLARAIDRVFHELGLEDTDHD